MSSAPSHITPQTNFWELGTGELWANRRLLGTLIERDLRVRYKNTLLGIWWVILQPLLSALIMSVVFARVLNFSAGPTNYLVYTLAGFTLWQFFASCVSYGVTSLAEQAALIKKIYFPRAYIPLTIVGRQLVDCGVSSLLLLIILIGQHLPLTPGGILGWVGGLVSLTLWASGLALLVSALGVLYRDVRHLIPFVVQIWFYLTPVFYDQHLLTGHWRLLVTLNPLAQILEFARTALFTGTLAGGQWLLVTLSGLVVFLVSLNFFKQTESRVVDQA